MTSSEFRKSFLNFFKSREHEIVDSSTVVPLDDPTLLFTNAGMNQFKNVFLGVEKPIAPRVTSVQKCIRASGKHNDLEDVGKDGRHHTFFEMLGNWSFGDYYKEEAIVWAWEFVREYMDLPEEKLWASVYKDDDEAYDIWLNRVKIPRERIVKLGDLEKGDMENFWSMGDTGPCGPCSEIHYDYFPSKEKDFIQASDRGEIIELWNLVFMEFNREADGSLKPLPSKSIDTGLGLERAVAILQGVQSDYETDLFIPLVKKVEEITGLSSENPTRLHSFQVIADHIRSLSFAIADGAIPSNEGRGYVLRRILRRAVRHGKLLGLDGPFLFSLVDTLVEVMGESYPELSQRKDVIQSILQNEEELFIKTLDRGLEEFNKTVKKVKELGSSVFPGNRAFILHDTYGFPLDLTAIMVEEQEMILDRGGFEKEMELQRKRAQEGSKFKGADDKLEWIYLRQEMKTEFSGYIKLEQKDMRLVKYNKSNGELLLVFDKTPFYGEAGGQVGDRGYIESGAVKIRITDVKRSGDQFIHIGVLEEGELEDIPYTGFVDSERRKKIMANHTATHLLHHALRRILGEHVTQAGSQVASDRLRFDFTHNSALTSQELKEIERNVNIAIIENHPVHIHSDISMDRAKSMGAIALFGEKYGDKVRVVEVEETSRELCGGTHVTRTGDIGVFKILKESSISSGVRRIEAVTNIASLELISKEEGILEEISRLLGTNVDNLYEKVRGLQSRVGELEKAVKRGKRKKIDELLDIDKQSVQAGNYTVVSLKFDDYSREELREISDRIKARLKMAVIILASVKEKKTSYVLTATDDAVKAGIHSGHLLKRVLNGCDGSGGGRPHLAQGGGTNPDNIEKAFRKLKAILEEG